MREVYIYLSLKYNMKDGIRYTEKISRREKDMQEGNVTRKYVPFEYIYFREV